MKKLIIILLISSCASLNGNNKSTKLTFRQQITICIKEFLELGVNPADSLNICQNIYKRK